MDILQQTFATPDEPEEQKNSRLRRLVALLFITAVLSIGVIVFVFTRPAAVIPEPIVIAPLGNEEVALYRATLPRNYIGGATSEDASTTPDFVPSADDVPVEVADIAVVSNPVVNTYIPSSDAVAVPVANMAIPAGSGESSSVPNPMAYVEGDIAVADVAIEQPDRANASPVSTSGVVVAVDTSTNRMTVTAGGEVIAVDMTQARALTGDGRLIQFGALAPNDMVDITGSRLANAPVVIGGTVTLVGVQEFIQVMDLGV